MHFGLFSAVIHARARNAMWSLSSLASNWQLNMESCNKHFYPAGGSRHSRSLASLSSFTNCLYNRFVTCAEA
jgi:hypothetical protein